MKQTHSIMKTSEGGGGEGGFSERTVRCTLLGDGMVGKTNLALGYLLQNDPSDQYTATVLDQYTVPLVVADKQFSINVCDVAGQSEYEALRAYSYGTTDVLLLCFSVCDRQSFDSLQHSWLPEIRKHLSDREIPLLLVGTQSDLRAKKRRLEQQESDLDSVQIHHHHHHHRNPEGRNQGHLKVAASRQGQGEDSLGHNRSAEDPRGHQAKVRRRDHRHSHPHQSAGTHTRQGHHKVTHHYGNQVDHQSQEEVSASEAREMAELLGADCYLECSARNHHSLQEVFKHVVLSVVRRRRRCSPTTTTTNDSSDDLTTTFRRRLGSNTSSSSGKKWSAGKFLGKLFPERATFGLSTGRKVGFHRSLPSLFSNHRLTLAA